jgi:ubiquinone/menaquinone biosynthesis C-methylase UbiE
MAEADHYPQIGGKYEVGRFRFGGADRKLLGQIGDISGKTIVAVAEGDGPYTVEMLNSGAKHVIALDRDTDALHTLEGNVPPDLRDRVQTVKADAFKPLPLADGSADIYLTTRFPNLYNGEQINSLFREAGRVLHDEGQIVFDFATHIKRTDPDGERIRGKKEKRYNLLSGYLTIRKALKDSGFERPKVRLTRVNQDLTESAGYRMKALKLNVSARKKAV